MRGRKDQHAAILAEYEVALLASRLVDDNQRLRLVEVCLPLSRAGAQGRASGRYQQHQEIFHGMSFRKIGAPLTRLAIREGCSRAGSPSDHRPARHA